MMYIDIRKWSITCRKFSSWLHPIESHREFNTPQFQSEYVQKIHIAIHICKKKNSPMPIFNFYQISGMSYTIIYFFFILNVIQCPFEYPFKFPKK